MCMYMCIYTCTQYCASELRLVREFVLVCNGVSSFMQVYTECWCVTVAGVCVCYCMWGYVGVSGGYECERVSVGGVSSVRVDM